MGERSTPVVRAGEVWLREEYQGREGELETRKDFFERTGVTTQSLSSAFTRYANRVPAVVKKFGKEKWFVAAELDDFIGWIKKNSGNRSETDIVRAEIARLDAALEEVKKRKAKHLESLAKADRDEARFLRARKVAQGELEFLEQGS